MKQMTMTQLVKAVKAGANLAEIAPEGADLEYLQKIIDNVDLNKKPAKKRQSRRGLPKKNRNYAEGVLYKRNAFDDKDIPFNGEPVAVDNVRNIHHINMVDKYLYMLLSYQEKIMDRIDIKLTYESLIALLQGKEFHLTTMDKHIVFHPPFDGMFLTHEQIDNIKYQSQAGVIDLMEKLQNHVEER